MKGTENRNLSTFDMDQFPGKPKILFIGLAQSSHTLSWINLLQNTDFNIRLFAAPPVSPPPSNWEVRTYLWNSDIPYGLDQPYRQSFYPFPEDIDKADYNRIVLRHPLFLPMRLIRKVYTKIAPYLGFPDLIFGNHPISTSSDKIIPIGIKLNKNLRIPTRDYLQYKSYIQLPSRAVSPEVWLKEIIETWNPDIIHTLGMDHSQGGFYFNGIRKELHIEKKWKWVVHTRGGSDMELNRFDPEKKTLIQEIFSECDQIISDNVINIKYASEMGITPQKFAPIVPVPGTGGIDLEIFSSARKTLPSQRERNILWLKAYDSEWSIALPVFEALKLCWEQIQPCKIYMLAMITPGTQAWSRSLPPNILQNSIIRLRVPRDEVFDLMGKARVLLSPSLIDGIPNSMYEAMASGTSLIVSPLDTIKTIVKEPENVLFARNLYPEEIAKALIRAMQDDTLVDQCAKNNFELVKQVADRNKIQEKVIRFYHSLL